MSSFASGSSFTLLSLNDSSSPENAMKVDFYA